MIQFLVHDKRDSVGVAVVDVKANQALQGRSLDTNEVLHAKSNTDIPLGHKDACPILRSRLYRLPCIDSRAI